MNEDRGWILMNSLGINGLPHMGQTLQIEDLRHLDEGEVRRDQSNLCRRLNRLTSNKTRAHIGVHGELCSPHLR